MSVSQDSVSLSGKGGRLGIGLPGGQHVPVAKKDGSVQIATVIESPESPEVHRYDLDLPDGATLQPQPGGKVAVTGADGSFLGGFAAPWARPDGGRVFSGPDIHPAHVAELRAKLGADAGLVTPTVEQQFLCHVTGNYAVWEFNMESWKPFMRWQDQLNFEVQCNP